MRSFAELDTLIGAVPFDVVRDLSGVDTGRGSELLFRDKLPALLTSLADRARVASIEASSAIEGVVVKNEVRAAEILAGRSSRLRTRSEQELAGYRAALDYLYAEDWRPLNVGLLQHLHRLLFQYTNSPGGAFKRTANVVVDRLADGTTLPRFTPVSAVETPYFTQELVRRFDEKLKEARHHPVLLTGLFVLDLLTIHPFSDGNGRVARALTNVLLQDAGYSVTRYVSFETSIARTSDGYYATLLASTKGWHEGRHDPWPWLRYFVRLLAQSYEEFAKLTSSAREGGGKQQRVRDYVLKHAPRTFQIADVRAALPGVSDQTIRLTLSQLKQQRRVTVDGVGRGARWTRED